MSESSGKWSGVERRNIADLTGAIAEETDPKVRSLLALFSQMFIRLETKLDAALNDEKALREMVLNGHASTHHDDHEWIARKRQNELEDGIEERKMKWGIKEKLIVAALLALASSGWITNLFHK